MTFGSGGRRSIQLSYGRDAGRTLYQVPTIITHFMGRSGPPGGGARHRPRAPHGSQEPSRKDADEALDRNGAQRIDEEGARQGHRQEARQQHALGKQEAIDRIAQGDTDGKHQARASPSGLEGGEGAMRVI